VAVELQFCEKVQPRPAAESDSSSRSNGARLAPPIRKGANTMRRARIAALLCGWLFVAPSAWATTIDFETLTDLEDITTQFPGLTFSDAVALQSGVVFGSLNEFDVPPHSDFTVAASLTGLMEIVFDDLMESFSGFFTYFANLEIRAFMGAMQVASATSLFANGNNELGFNPGSSNEFLSVFFAGGFNRIELSSTRSSPTTSASSWRRPKCPSRRSWRCSRRGSRPSGFVAA
jgi:hypothetical protein